MKLTPRQRKILLVSVLSFFLVLVVVVSTVLIANKNQNPSPSVPKKNNLPNDANLAKTKTETITLLGQKLSSDNIRNEDLLKELKDNNYLATGETNLKEYIEGATTLAELEIRKKKVLEIVEKLIGNPAPGPSSPSPGPSSPSPGPSSPSPGPSSPSPGPSSPSSTWWLTTEEIEHAYKEIKGEGGLILFEVSQAHTIKLNKDYVGFLDHSTITEWKNAEIIFLPVNNSSTSAGGGHWSLLAYKKGGTFYYYDSMGSSNLSSAQTLANNFLKCLKISGEAKLNQTSCPQQPNGYDCGVYTIIFTRSLVEKYKKDKSAIANNNFWEIKTEDFVFSPQEERNRLIKAGFPKKSSGSPDASEDNVSDEDTIYFESEEDRISHWWGSPDTPIRKYVNNNFSGLFNSADNFKEFSKKVRKLSARTKTQLGGENLKKILRIKRILKICSDPAGDFGGKVNEEYVRESIKQEIVNEINKLYTTWCSN